METPLKYEEVTIDVPQPMEIKIKKKKPKFEIPEPESAKNPKNFYLAIIVLIFSLLLLVFSIILFAVSIAGYFTPGIYSKQTLATPYLNATWIIVSIFMFFTSIVGLVSAILYKIPKPRLVVASLFIVSSLITLFSCFGSFTLLPIISYFADKNTQITSATQVWILAGASLILSLLCCIGYIICGGFEFYYSYYEQLERKEIEERYKDQISVKKLIYVSSV